MTPRPTASGSEPRSVPPDRTHVHLLALTGAKTVANTALRWVGPFLPTIGRAFDASTGTLTAVLGVAELAGLSTTWSGRAMDAGRRRRIFLAGCWAVTASSLLALVGSLWWFAVAMFVLVLGVANLTVAGHAWISVRVPYRSRGRAIGVFELSWALSLLLGAPILALVIAQWGWRGPFVVLAIASAIAAVVVTVVVPGDDALPRSTSSPVDAHRDRRRRPEPLPRGAWSPLLGSALTGGAGMAVFVVSGAWLSDRHGVSTGGLGLVAMLMGALELVASGTSAGWSDRLGKARSTAGGLVVLLVGLGVVAVSGSSLLVAVVGFVVFLAGFEYAFVTGLSLVSEAAPEARGRALGIGNALGTLARSAGVLASGQLYEAVGLGGSLWLSAVVTTVALAFVVDTARRQPDRPTESSPSTATAT